MDFQFPRRALLRAIGFSAAVNPAAALSASTIAPAQSLDSMIFESAIEVRNSRIEQPVTFIRTNGYYVANGKGAAHYRLKLEEEPDEPGQLLSDNGAKRWALAFNQQLNLFMFGALGIGEKGRLQDTAAIEAAFAYGEAFPARNVSIPNDKAAVYRLIGGLEINIPPGEFVYDGDGYLADRNRVIRLCGAGPAVSAIHISKNIHLMKWTNESTSVCNYIEIQNLKFMGGKGVFLNTKINTTNIQAGKRVVNCDFIGYHGVAFGSFAYEDEQWHIEDNTFFGGDTGLPIGLLIPPQMAIGAITGNNFWGNSYDIKAFADGIAAFLIGPNNSFYTAAARLKSADLWIVPLASPTNGGTGCRIFGNRFSNENYDGTWPRILVANEDKSVGIDSSQHPHSTSISAGHFQGWTCDENFFEGVGNPSSTPNNVGIICSYTPNIGPFHWGKNNTITQWYPWLIMFQGAITPNVASMLSVCSVEFNCLASAVNNYEPKVSNLDVVGMTSRAAHFSQGDIGEWALSASSDPTYINCNLYEGMRVDYNSKGTKVTTIRYRDVLDGESAALVQFGADQIMTLAVDKAKLIVGQICFFEFDIKRAPNKSLDAIQFEIRDSSSAFSRTIHLTNSWKRCVLPWLIPQDYSTETLSVHLVPRHFLSPPKDSFLLGRQAIYMATKPINYGHLETKESSWDGGHLVLGHYHLWIAIDGTLRIKRGSPNSDTDGHPV